MCQLQELRRKDGSGVSLSPLLFGASQHYQRCCVCGQAFDKRSIVQVSYHEKPEHKPLPLDG